MLKSTFIFFFWGGGRWTSYYHLQIKLNLPLGYLTEDHFYTVKIKEALHLSLMVLCVLFPCLRNYILCIEFLWSLWFISTNCTLCVKYDLNHKFVLPDIPYEFNLSSTMSWFMTSYTFAKLKNNPCALDPCPLPLVYFQ